MFGIGTVFEGQHTPLGVIWLSWQHIPFTTAVPPPPNAPHVPQHSPFGITSAAGQHHPLGNGLPPGSQQKPLDVAWLVGQHEPSGIGV